MLKVFMRLTSFELILESQIFLVTFHFLRFSLDLFLNES